MLFRSVTIAIKPILNTPDSGIILGDKELTIAPIATPDSAIKSAYSKGPLLESHPSQPPTNDMLAESQAEL